MSSPGWLEGADRASPWSQLRVLVAGLGVSGYAAADSLLQLGAAVVVVDERDAEVLPEQAQILEVLGAELHLHAGATASLPAGIDLVVTSPGWRPDNPLLGQAAEQGIAVWGEVELAWRLRPARPAPWLVVTGTNGKTTVVEMLTAILHASGLRAVAAGNVGTPVVEAVMHPEPYDVIAVELSSFQLHWTHSLRARAAAVLNVAPDHLDWHGSLAAYAKDKGRIYQNAEVACIYNLADPVTEQLVREAEVQEGCRAIGFTLGIPAVGMLGVVDDLLVDRAFIDERQSSAAELVAVPELASSAPHFVSNALAAAALARSIGVPTVAVRDGLRSFAPGAHRLAEVALVRGVRYVDDSKATNAHAAAASLASFDDVVWVAGGLAKGGTFDDLVREHAGRLRAAVLLGRDRALILDALRRHAPDVPVIEVADRDTEAMERVVREAAALARPGQTVLLAPACASMDMYDSYAARGDAFAAAVRALAS